jgi:hypothetical protein
MALDTYLAVVEPNHTHHADVERFMQSLGEGLTYLLRSEAGSTGSLRTRIHRYNGRVSQGSKRGYVLFQAEPDALEEADMTYWNEHGRASVQTLRDPLSLTCVITKESISDAILERKLTIELAYDIPAEEIEEVIDVIGGKPIHEVVSSFLMASPKHFKRLVRNRFSGYGTGRLFAAVGIETQDSQHVLATLHQQSTGVTYESKKAVKEFMSSEWAKSNRFGLLEE